MRPDTCDTDKAALLSELAVNGIIKYDADLGMLEVENILDSVDVDAVGNVEGLCRIDIRYAEVIGNIWQNTELLEVE